MLPKKSAHYTRMEIPSKTNYDNILSKLLEVKNLKNKLEKEKNRTKYLHHQLIYAEKFNVDTELHFLKEMHQKELLNKYFNQIIIAENKKLISKNDHTYKIHINLRNLSIGKIKQTTNELEKSLGLFQFNEKLYSKTPDESIINAQKATNKIKTILSELELTEEKITVNLKPHNLSPMFNRLIRDIRKSNNVKITYKIKKDDYVIPCEIKKFRVAIALIIESLIDLMKDKKIFTSM